LGTLHTVIMVKVMFLCLIKHHTWKAYATVAVQCLAFLISTVGQWAAACRSYFTPRYDLDALKTKYLAPTKNQTTISWLSSMQQCSTKICMFI
jgi:hypothetical protein